MAVLMSERPKSLGENPAVVNDFSFVAATANGTGSQTANLAILRSLFKMGIPVHGKNIFPSNIQGLPTWYQIRVSKHGYVARPENPEILIAFNRATFQEDVVQLPSGGVCIYNADWKTAPQRDDIISYALPVRQLSKDSGMKGKFISYIANMVYVGAAAFLFGIRLEAIEEALMHQFAGKAKAVAPNFGVVNKAFDWCSENLEKHDPYLVKEMDNTEGLILLTGNEAAGLGSVYGGTSFVAWYPITPSTSLVDAYTAYATRLRKDGESTKNTFGIIQAEDELAAIGMVIGAGWAGARAMTATSGPGLSLMAEFAGMSYFSEVPAVIWDVQRVGPSTGLPTRTGQCDVTFAYYLGHGDTKNVLLFPSDLQDCFDYGTLAHNLADELQSLVLVLSDLDLGMNNWMSEPLRYPTEDIKRGKVLSAEELREQNGDWGRYRDVDGDGIGYRTLPGTDHPNAAYFNRGSGHNEDAVYSERSDVWLHNMNRLKRKFETARKLVPKPVIQRQEGARIGIIAYGTTKYAIDEARDQLLEDGLATDFMRLQALPIGKEVRSFIDEHDYCYVIELNRDGQMHAILQSEMPELATKLISLAEMDGMPLSAQWVLNGIRRLEYQDIL